MFTNDLLKGKRILITGGGTGIGRALAERFLRLGAMVYICGRRKDVIEQTTTELRSSTGGTIEGFGGIDVRELDDVEPLIEKLWASGPLDVLVNNAAGNFLAKTEELSAHAFDAVIGIVLKGTINMTIACGRRWLKEDHRAVVLNIATTYAELGSAYVVPSAGAIRTEGAFSRLLPVPAMEKALLDHNPLHRLGTLDEISNLAIFLISDQSGYINGEMVYMDGGEMLAGSSSFSLLGRMIPEDTWGMLKQRKK